MTTATLFVKSTVLEHGVINIITRLMLTLVYSNILDLSVSEMSQFKLIFFRFNKTHIIFHSFKTVNHDH